MNEFRWTGEDSASVLVSCDRAWIRFQPLYLVRHQFPISSIRLEGPFADLNGIIRISKTVIPGGNPVKDRRRLEWPFKNCCLEISNGVVLWMDTSGVMASGLNARLSWDDSLRMDGSFSADSITLRSRAFSGYAGRLGAVWSTAGEKVTADIFLEHEGKSAEARAVLDLSDFQGHWILRDEEALIPLFIGLESSPVTHIVSKGSFSGKPEETGVLIRSVLLLGSPSGFIPDSVFLSGRILTRQVKEISIRTKWMDGRMEIRGELGLDPQTASACTLETDHVSLEALWREVRKSGSPFTGHFNGRLTAAGPGPDLFRWRANGRLSLPDAVFEGDPISPLVSNLRLNPDSLVFTAIQGPTRFTGRFKNPSLGPEGTFRLRNLRTRLLVPWIHLEGFSGRMHASGKWDGTWQNPKGIFHAESEDLHVGFASIDTLTITGIYDAGKWVIQKAVLAARSDTSGMTSENPSAFHGNFSTRGNVSGPVDSLNGFWTIRGSIREWSGIRIDTLSMKNVLAGGFIIPSARIQTDSSEMLLSGRMKLAGLSGRLNLFLQGPASADTGTISIHGERKNGFQMSTGQNGLPVGALLSVLAKPPSLTGKLHAEGDFNRDSGFPSGRLGYYTEALLISERPCRLTGRFRYQSGRLRFRHTLAASGDSLSLHGELFSFSPADAATLPGAVIAARFGGHIGNIAPYFQAVYPDYSFRGILESDVGFSGTLASPRLSGYLSLREGMVRPDPYQVLAENLELTSHFNQDSLEANLRGQFGTRDFSMWGKLIYAMHPRPLWTLFWKSDSSSISVNGEMSGSGWNGVVLAKAFDLSHLQPFFPDVTGLGGRLDASIPVRPQDDSSGEGHLRISNAAFSVSDGLQVSRCFIKVRLGPNTLSIDTLISDVNQGTVKGKGIYSHRMFTHLSGRMLLEGRNLQFKKANAYQIKFDSLRVTLSSQETIHSLTADILLGESKLSQSVRLKEILAWLDRTRQPWKAGPAFMKNARMNVLFRNEKPFWIDNNLARLQLSSQLTLNGTPSDPYFMGSVSVREGYIFYLDRKFEVRKGKIEYTSPKSVYPEIDFKGESGLKSFQTCSGTPYTVRMSVTGPANNLSIRMESEPVLAEADILTLLTLGATRRELTRENPGDSNQLTDMLKDRLTLLSSQQVSAYASKTIGGLFGLDHVSMEGNLFKFGKSWGPQLLASKKISDKLSLTYKTAVGQSNAQDIRLDYRLTKRISLEGQTNQEGESGIDLLYQVRF